LPFALIPCQRFISGELMQQRQLRLGDILDDYCPRERRVTNHAVVAMIGEDVKQTRCTTCDADHEYKHAKVPRQRRKTETPAALYSQVLANGPKRVSHDGAASNGSDDAAGEPVELDESVTEPAAETPVAAAVAAGDVEVVLAPSAPPEEILAAGVNAEDDADVDGNREEEEGPVHRPLIRASLPRQDGQQPPSRPIPEFTIRQPGGRPNRFRPRHQGGAGPRGGGGQQFQGNRSNGNQPGGPPRGMRPGGGRPPHGPQGAVPSRLARRNGPGRKRSK
jgi:hypothetical protein